jgi:DNA-3-methyladenine glycosylase II
MSAKEFASQLIVAEAYLAKSSPLIRRLARRHGPCKLSPKWRQSPYESLVRAVVHQQLHGVAAGRILDRFVSLLSRESAFPSCQEVLQPSDDELRSVGLSWRKVSYIRAIAQEAVDGRIPVKRSSMAKASDDEIVAQLTQIRGVGRWTVEMMLIFTLGRLDVLPVDDYGVRKGFSSADGRDVPVTPGELKTIGMDWAPYRSVAAWYFWREADQT